MMRPILYSFRRCPYAMRARLAIRAAGIEVVLREVSLKAKPQAMLDVSPKGTVPVLILPDGRVIEQSLDVMRWALGDFDSPLIERNDSYFKTALDLYKYAEQDKLIYRSQGEIFLAELNALLHNGFLSGDSMGALDWAILPFVRQFAAVDAPWFAALPYTALQKWLNDGVTSPLFMSIMQPHKAWQDGDAPVIF